MPEEQDRKPCDCHGIRRDAIDTHLMNGYTQLLKTFMSEGNLCPNPSLLGAFATFLIINCLQQHVHPVEFLTLIGKNLAQAIKEGNILTETVTAKKPN